VKKQSTIRWVALLLAVLAVGGAVGYLVAVRPQRERAAELQTQIDDVRDQIAAVNAASSSPGSPPIHVADLFQLSRAMPDRSDMPNLLLQLSEVATETGVTFESIVPHAPEVVGDYRRIPIDLVFEGRFYDLSDFLYRLRNLVGVHDGRLNAVGRLFSIGSLSFDEGALQFPQVKASLTVDAYAYGDGTQTTAPAPAEPSGVVASGATGASPSASGSVGTEAAGGPIPAAGGSSP